MTTTIKRGASKKTIALKLQKLKRSSVTTAQGLDAYKYCGIIKLKKAPEKIQKQLRGEWE